MPSAKKNGAAYKLGHDSDEEENCAAYKLGVVSDEEEDSDLGVGFIDVQGDRSTAPSPRPASAAPKGKASSKPIEQEKKAPFVDDGHWLDRVEALGTDEAAAGDASARGRSLDLLGDGCDVAKLTGTCDRLMQYLIGHPKQLVGKGRRAAKGGKAAKRYFAEEGPSEDVMADKRVAGCWACGKLDHDATGCPFKRCYVCSSTGHPHWDCPHKSAWCSWCRSKGHWPEQCPTSEYSSGIQDELRGTCVPYVRCITCREVGHLNCAPIPRVLISDERWPGKWGSSGECDGDDDMRALRCDPAKPLRKRRREDSSPEPPGRRRQPSTWGRGRRDDSSPEPPARRRQPSTWGRGRSSNSGGDWDTDDWHWDADEWKWQRRSWQQRGKHPSQWRHQWPRTANASEKSKKGKKSTHKNVSEKGKKSKESKLKTRKGASRGGKKQLRAR